MPEISLISVVVPVYNSTSTLDELLAETKKAVAGNKYSLEVIFVDDHGKPESWNKLKQLKSANEGWVKIVRLSKNFGQNSATLCGIDHANGEIIITIDDDMEFHPKHIPELIAKAEEDQLDVVYGIFDSQRKKSLRSVGRRGLLFVMNRVENGASLGSSFRLIRKNVVEKLKNHSQDHLFINQVISWYTSDIGQVQIPHNVQEDGKSGYSLAQLIKIGMRLIFYYTSFPLKLIIYFSFLIALICVCFVMYYLIQRLTVGTVPGYSSVIISIFAGTSVIMFSVGVLAIFVNRIYNSRIKRPNYSIKKME